MPPIDSPARSSSAPRRSPRWVFVQLSIALAALSIVGAWITDNYWQEPSGATYSFPVSDGWCDPPTQGIGLHCFGDFQLPLVFLDEPASVWERSGSIGAPISVTPTGMLPHVASKALIDSGLGPKITLWLFLIVLALALLTPALVAIWQSRRGLGWLIPILILGVATQPVWNALDRGTTVGFTVPLLLVFALTADRDPPWLAPAAVILATSVRPQFILLALAFIAFGRWRAFVSTIAAAVGVQLISFIVWPGNFTETTQAWFRNLSGYSTYGGLGPTEGSANVSLAQAVALAGRALGALPGWLGSAGSSLTEWAGAHASIPGIVLVVLVIVCFILARNQLPRVVALTIALALPALVPGTVFSYYLTFVLVVGALILGPQALRRESGLWRFEATGGLDRLMSPAWIWWRWLLVAITAITLFPLPFRFLGGLNSGVMYLGGVTWSLVVGSALAVALTQQIRENVKDGAGN